MSKRTPNSEQLLAIEHSGGVLLRAGAGSGKTFVLVEHIVYLTRQWLLEFKKMPTGHFEEFIRTKFSQVVMMTFTKKAAGEMSIRLTEKFAELSATEEDDRELWVISNQALPVLTVTTIDGFCRKLIAAGYFPHLSTEAKIIFETERIDQVKELLRGWFEKRSHVISPDILDIVIREKEALLAAISSIFNDAGLRLAWKNFTLSDTHPDKLGKLLAKSFELKDLTQALGAILALDLPAESERSAFEKFIALAQSTGLPEVDHANKLALYCELFEGKRLDGERSAAKKALPSHLNALAGLQALRDWSRIWGKVVKDYTTHYETKVLPWIELCHELFQWVEERLDPNQGMTFGDIAYHVALGLEHRPDRERIHKAYQYFIVDEFQDTSALQFQIIQSLIGSDYQRLFCVGDAKQAIYGFRGGELSVFQDCSELVPQVRSLANNYRSLPEVINFNNSLFRTLLPLGQEFQGVDPFSVKPEDQHIPSDCPVSEKGVIEILSAILVRDLENEGKFTNEDINRLEAQLLADSIAQHRQSRPTEVCTILYTKLKPSAELIKKLMEQKIGFTAQYKIDLLDDPVIGMFLALLRRKFDSNKSTREKYPLFILRSYLKVLALEREITAQHLADFDRNVEYWGLLEGFRKFLHTLQITNENSDINLGVIETLAQIYQQDPESIMVQLKDGNNQRVSLDLRSGENAHLVQIMSAHASKGLEFDVVYLAGIYTNGKENNDGDLFGQLPGSFNWYQDLSLRDKQPSPFYVFEHELSRYKSFSEAKRLFYVACTRARKKLSWVSFEIPEKTFSIPKNSWIDGLTTWFAHGLDANCSQAVVVKEMTDFDSRALLLAHTLPQLPLFFHDSVGVFSKGEGESELALAAELSVTRLNTLVDCPRKFYLENILKLNAGKTSRPKFWEDDDSEEEEEEEELVSVIKSSAQRGTSIHELIARGISHNFIAPRETLGQEVEKPVQWALNELSSLRENFQFIAEKPLKFKFFNFMISGIPDLLLISQQPENSSQVWDFKTGRITQENLDHYWIQLKAYAYALYVLKSVPLTDSIETKLCFVDEQKILSLQVNWMEIQAELYQLWRQQNRPWSIKTDHCGQCSYVDICIR